MSSYYNGGTIFAEPAAAGNSLDYQMMEAVATDLNGLPPILTDLREREVAFTEMLEIQHIPARACIADAEGMQNQMFILMEGRANIVCESENGRRLVMERLEPGAIFGYRAVLNYSDLSRVELNMRAEADSEAVIWTVPAEKTDQLLSAYPIITWALLQSYGDRLCQVEEAMESVAYRKLPERLCTVLWELADHETWLVSGYSHQILADYLGTYRETVSAILRTMKREGVVDIGYRRIQICDFEAVRDMAGIID